MRRLIREGDPPAGQLASPVPQYWNPNTEAFEDVLGAHGAPRAILYGPNGQPIGSSNPLPVADSALAQAVAQLATEGKLEEARALLETISQKDFATQTTLSEVLQRLEAIEEQLETGDAKVQLKGSNVDDGQPVSALSVVLDNDGHPVLRVVDVAPPALDEVLDRWRVVFDPPARSETIILDTELRHASARAINLAATTDIARCRDYEILISNTLKDADGAPCRVQVSFFRTPDGNGSTYVLTESGKHLIYYPGTNSICHSFEALQNVPLSLIPAESGNGVDKAIDPQPYKRLGHNITLMYQSTKVPVEGRLRMVFVGVPN